MAMAIGDKWRYRKYMYIFYNYNIYKNINPRPATATTGERRTALNDENSCIYALVYFDVRRAVSFRGKSSARRAAAQALLARDPRT